MEYADIGSLIVLVLPQRCSQLEEQRLFYERRLASANESESRQLVTALENDKKQLKKANETLAHKAHKLEDELTFVRHEA